MQNLSLILSKIDSNIESKVLINDIEKLLLEAKEIGIDFLITAFSKLVENIGINDYSLLSMKFILIDNNYSKLSAETDIANIKEYFDNRLLDVKSFDKILKSLQLTLSLAIKN